MPAVITELATTKVCPSCDALNIEHFFILSIVLLLRLSCDLDHIPYRIDSNSLGKGSIEDVAFQNPDGSIVLLVLNSGAAADFTVSWKGRSFNYTLPAGAVATFLWKQ